MSKTTVVNLYKEPYDVYIGRPGKGQDGYFGNPYRVSQGEPHGSTLHRFRLYFMTRIETDPEFKRRIESLRGKRLGCFCKPKPCHGDVIADYLNNSPAPRQDTK